MHFYVLNGRLFQIKESENHFKTHFSIHTHTDT